MVLVNSWWSNREWLLASLVQIQITGLLVYVPECQWTSEWVGTLSSSKWKLPDLSRTVMHGPHAWLTVPGFHNPSLHVWFGCRPTFLTARCLSMCGEEEKNLWTTSKPNNINLPSTCGWHNSRCTRLNIIPPLFGLKSSLTWHTGFVIITLW